MTIVTDFGVTPSGFVLKPVDVLLNEAIDRARSVFPGADLTSTSALFKILQTTAAEDGELWKRLEDLYFGNFMSTAIGDTLDQLGEDVGVARRQLPSTGTVRITLDNPVAGQRHVLPEGTIVVTGEPVQAFATVAPVTLDATTRTADVGVVAFERGLAGDVDAHRGEPLLDLGAGEHPLGRQGVPQGRHRPVARCTGDAQLLRPPPRAPEHGSEDRQQPPYVGGGVQVPRAAHAPGEHQAALLPDRPGQIGNGKTGASGPDGHGSSRDVLRLDARDRGDDRLHTRRWMIVQQLSPDVRPARRDWDIRY